MAKLVAALLVALVAVAAAAGEEPEAVYAKFHKAGREANFAELRKWGTKQKGDEAAAMPAAMQSGMLRMMAAMLPKTYTVTGRRIEPARATLHVRAPQEGGTIYGVVTLLKEGGEWRVDEEKWGEPAPASATAAKPAAAQAAAAAIPAGSARGMVNGAAFSVEQATIQGGILKLRQGREFFADREFVLFLFLKGAAPDGRRIVGTGEDFSNPHVHLSYKVEGKGVPKTEIFMKGYRITLEFGQRSGNRLPGRIDLRLPDKAGSFVSGTFEAELK
jgi:hypothetical protein